MLHLKLVTERPEIGIVDHVVFKMVPNTVTLSHINYPELVSLCDCCVVSFSECAACANLKCLRTKVTDDSKWSSRVL